MSEFEKIVSNDSIYKDPETRSKEQAKKISPNQLIKNGLLLENPVFRLVLGICPVLAITTAASNAISMGLAVIFVLTLSEFVISLLRHIIPDQVRIPAFITIIAGFVTIVQLLISAYAPALNEALGIYIPLIVVNCIVLARAEAFASKRSPLLSIIDGLSMGAGFTAALFFIASLREILGNGSFFGIQLPFFGTVIEPIMFFILPPGGFFIFGICIAVSQIIIKAWETKHKQPLTPGLEVKSCEMCNGCLQAADKADRLTQTPKSTFPPQEDNKK